MKIKFRYRFKGKYSNGERKLVLERIDENGKIKGVNLPKASEMWEKINKFRDRTQK